MHRIKGVLIPYREDPREPYDEDYYAPKVGTFPESLEVIVEEKPEGLLGPDGYPIGEEMPFGFQPSKK